MLLKYIFYKNFETTLEKIWRERIILYLRFLRQFSDLYRFYVCKICI